MEIFEGFLVRPPLLLLLFLAACTETVEQTEPYNIFIDKALKRINLNRESISLPKVPKSISSMARLSLVDSVLEHPPGIIDLGNRIRNIELRNSRSEYIGEIIGLLGIGKN